MKKMTIGTKLMSGAGALVALTVVLSLIALNTIGEFKQQFDVAADKTTRKIELAEELLTANSEMTSEQRGDVLAAVAKDSAELDAHDARFRENIKLLQADLVEIRPLLITPEGMALVSDITGRVAEWQTHYEELLRACQAGNPTEANRIRKDVVVPIYRKIDAGARRLVAIQKELLAKDKASLASLHSQSRWISFGLLGLSLLIGSIVMAVVRGINQKLRHAVSGLASGAEQVASAAVQISSASQSLAQGSSEQAASLEETSASGEEISSMARRNTENTRSAADLVNSSQQKFQATNQSLEQMVSAMDEINAQSTKISKIIKVIDEIAFQTNILALNAAVEAARAGEAGMGFAVVADEVRNLAQRCAQAAKDTATLIEESISKSNGGKARVDQVAAAIRAITEESAKVRALVDDVNLGSQEQARGLQQVTESLAQMDQVTQQTAANAEESAASAEELSAQSEALQDIVRQLADMVGATSATSAVRSAPRRASQPRTVALPSKAPIAPRESEFAAF